MKKQTIQHVINFIFVVLTAYTMGYFLGYWLDDVILDTRLLKSCAPVLVFVLIINLLKGLRGYILLFDYRFEKREYMLEFILTSLVNQFVPYRLGEIFRGFRYGKLIGSYSEGYVAMILDRFVDTLALVTIVLVTLLTGGSTPSDIYYILGGFILLIFVIYQVFDSLYHFWNRTLLKRPSSKHTLQGLRLLKNTRRAVQSVEKMASGKMLILYVLSILAWATEVYSMVYISRKVGGTTLAEYLNSILGSGQQASNAIFIVFSLILYIVVLVGLLFIRPRKNQAE